MPGNLIVIVACQAALLIAALVLFRIANQRVGISWLLAGGIGVGFGVFMDAVLGIHGIFAYLPNGPQAPFVRPKDLPLEVLIFNALASYGVAAATVATISARVVTAGTPATSWSSRLTIAPLFGSIAVTLCAPASVPMMVAWGAILIGGGELALYVSGRSGPFLSLLSGSGWKPVVTLWAFSFVIGSIYEVCNTLFPFWIWLPGADVDTFRLKVLISTLGYMALMHPMAVLYILLDQPQDGKRQRLPPI